MARGSSPFSIKPRPKSAHDVLGLLYCFIVLLCIGVVSCPYVIYCPTVMARYSIFVLKVPLNPKQTNKSRLLFNLPFFQTLLQVRPVPNRSSKEPLEVATVRFFMGWMPFLSSPNSNVKPLEEHNKGLLIKLKLNVTLLICIMVKIQNCCIAIFA